MFSIDGIQWPYPCEILRSAEVRSSAISGLMLDRRWFNDVLGTYMAYAVRLAVPVTRRDDYARIYEALTDPVDGHAFVLPYNGGTISLTARVTKVSDEAARLTGGGVAWRGIRFDIAANHPSKARTFEQVMAIGRSPLPDIAAPGEGDAYTYHDGEWVISQSYTDADGVWY